MVSPNQLLFFSIFVNIIKPAVIVKAGKKKNQVIHG